MQLLLELKLLSSKKTWSACLLYTSIAVNGKRIPIKISAGAIFLEPYMKETNAVRSRLTYAQNHSRYEHHSDLVIFNDEICGNNEKQFELIGLIHQCATSHFEGFRLFYQPIADTKTGKIRGMEALIRWELEPYGLISPGIFMEWLEEDPCIFDPVSYTHLDVYKRQIRKLTVSSTLVVRI